jgi:KaiC/GvpD/RAD55 family RecA-like ATPase
MVLLFRHPYERRAEKAAEGGAKVVVVGPPCAGKTTFIKQFLESRGVEAAEETAGLALGSAAGEGLVQRLRRRVRGRYVRGDEVEKELAGIGGADLLKAFDKLPRDFVEHLKERYGGWSLYLFYIPPDAEYEEAKRLRAVMEEVGVEFRWFGLSYLPPGLAKALAEKGEDYVRRQLKLYKELGEELDIAEGRLRKAAESALESLLDRVKEVAERLIDVAAPGAGVAASILTEVLTALLLSRGGQNEFIKLVAGLGELDEALRCILAARLALALGLDRGAVEKALATLAGADAQKLAEEVKALKNAADRLWVEVKSAKRGLDVLFLEDVEMGYLYENFVALNEKPYVDLQEGLFPLVAGGRFEEEARRVLEKLESGGVAVLVGPKGIGKSTLAAYVVWKMLSGGGVEAAIRVEKSAKELTLKRTLDFVKRGVVVLYDPSPLEVYYKHRYMEKTKRPEKVVKALEELADFLKKEGGRVRLLVVLPTDLYKVVKDKVFRAFKDAALKKAFKNAVLEIKLNDVEFLHSVIKTYSSCGGDYSKLAEEIARFKGGYTLVAKYAGLWLRERGRDASDVERAVEEAKKEPKLFLAHYIWHVLLRGSSDLAKRAAVPLLLHARFGPVPVGVTYITKAVNDGVWRFLKPEELEGAGLEYLREDVLEPIARWLAQWHEDLVEEALRDLAGLNGEETRETYREALRDLIKALDWARDEVLEEGGKILVELGIPKDKALKVFNIILTKFGIPEKDRELATSLLAFISRRLAAVFKSDENKRCWRRIALIVGLALAGSPVLPLGVQLPKDAAETMGDALKPCAVDDYLMIGNEIPTLLLNVVWFSYYVEAQYARDLWQIQRIRERLGVLTPYADTEVIRAVKKITDEPVSRWRRRLFTHFESFYALGLAALVSGSEVDGETADMLLYIASVVTRWVFQPVTALPILAALRPLGEKAPHKYVATLVAASQLKTLDPETVWYIYDALQQFKDRLLEGGRIWPLVEAIDAYSNLLRKHLIHIEDRWEEAVANMCSLYYEVKKRYTTGLNGGFSAQRLLDTVAGAYVVAVALNSDNLAQLMQRHCGLSDIVKEAEAVRSVLDEAATHPEELRKIMENDADFKEWVTTRSPIGDAGRMAKMLTSWFMHELAHYKLVHAINERGELDEKKLKEAAEDLEKAAEIDEKLERWSDYLASRSLALRTRILASKSWEEFHKTAESFQKLWEETEEHLDPSAEYLVTAVDPLGEYLVYLAAFGDKERAEKLLKEWQWLLDYVPEASVITRLMLRLFSMGEGAKLEEVVDVFEPHLSPEFRPALLMLAGRLQRDEAFEECAKSLETEICVSAVVAAAGNQAAIELLRSSVRRAVPKARLLLDKVDGKTLVEVLASRSSQALFAFILLAATEGKTDAVRLHGLLSSVAYEYPVSQPLFRTVYENCGNLYSEGCRLALLKLYYFHF